MLFDYLIDLLCTIVVIGLGVIALGCFVAAIVLIIGEERKWW